MNKTVLITGASSGIGRELARLFARDGYNLVLTARNQNQLEQLAEELRARHNTKTTIIIKDLAKPTSPLEIFDELQQQSIQVDILVNNAGMDVYGLFVEADLDQQMLLIQVNITSLVHLTRLLLPGMTARGYGKILNLGSTGSYGPGPLSAVYCATKAFVLNFSEAIAAELSDSGVTVTALCPGATDTPFAKRYELEETRLFQRTMSAERVAEIGYRALMKGRLVVVAGLGNQLQVLMFSLLGLFLPLTPPKILKQIGFYVMGKINP